MTKKWPRILKSKPFSRLVDRQHTSSFAYIKVDEISIHIMQA